MKQIKQKYAIKSPVEIVWQALVNPEVIEKWGGGPAKMRAKAGEKFSLWGGDIYGKNTRVLEGKELDQDWYQKGWKKPSKVVFKLSKKGNHTELLLTHKNVPDQDLVDIAEGWKEYYLGPLKEYLEDTSAAR